MFVCVCFGGVYLCGFALVALCCFTGCWLVFVNWFGIRWVFCATAVLGFGLKGFAGVWFFGVSN